MKRLRWMIVLLGLLLHTAASASTVLVVNQDQLEANSAVVLRLKAEALQLQVKKTGKGAPINATYAEALEASLSDLRVAFPKVVADIAKTKKADLVVSGETAKRLGLTVPDITAEVQAKLDAQFKQLKLIAP